jgi:23S rRNA pseudouridine2605 synthase
MPKEFSKKKDASRPTKSSYRGSDRSAGSGSGAKSNYSSKSSDFKARSSSPSSDRPFKKSYADDSGFSSGKGDTGAKKEWNTDRPKKSYGSDFKSSEKKEGGERKNWSNDRPKKSFSSYDKPRDGGDSRESKSFESKRPAKKNFDKDFKSRESADGEEKKSWFSDRQKKSPSSDYKPRENREGGERKTWSNDRPKKPYTPDSKSRESSGGDKKNWSSDRPKRSYTADDSPRERSKGGERKNWDSNRPIKKFENRGSKYAPENFASAPSENSESAKPRRARVSTTKKKPEVEESDLQYGSVRLNKYIANAGICSRREADVLIETGAITVNGKMVNELGYKVSATDIVAYGGQGIRREKNVYILLNKPKDYITTADDPLERKTVMHLIKGACKERVYPVGRLDRNSTGLLIMTNDGELTKKLTHPRYEKKKIYHIELDRPLTKDDMNKILEGVELEDGMVHVDEISYVTGADSKREVGIELHSGKNRVIRRIFEHLNYDVKKLDRVYFAGLSKKDLPRGRWRFLTEREVAMLNSK